MRPENGKRAENRRNGAPSGSKSRQIPCRKPKSAQITGLLEVPSIIAADPQLARRHEILTSIGGLGTLTANQLIATMPELGTLENKQAASLAGLAPVARQSGQWKGKSFIRGGRANVRQALYMPALVAARFNPDLKAKYQQLIAQGKPAKIAITAVMRKLVVIANTLLKADRLWVKSLA